MTETGEGAQTGEPSSQSPVVLALDGEGGDQAPGEIVAGARAVASEALRVLLVGRPQVLDLHLSRSDRAFIEIVPSEATIGGDEEPAFAIRSKPASSIAVGARLVAEGKAQGFIGAGSTGAMLAAGLLLVKRVKGLKRPAILTVLPGLQGPVVFLDAGANADTRPEHLLEFGMLGSVFARCGLGIAAPTVALLNIGAEAAKGNDLALAAHSLLAQSSLDFRGNIEGGEILTNRVDVIVTDGFTGNVALKVLEGAARSMMVRLRRAAGSDLRSKAGGLLLRPALVHLGAVLDPEEYGGTYLLGLRGLVVICHGNSSRRAIANALRFGAQAVRQGVVESVAAEVCRAAEGVDGQPAS